MSLKRKKRFVVQQHMAEKAGNHYDFRLEMPTKIINKNVLVSWAIRKGPSLGPSVKRLAIQTEDHDVKYGNFEGIIEKGQYGAGKTIIWDKGTYEILTPGIKTKEDLEKVKTFEFFLYGKKLKGTFVMIKTKRGWLFKKKADEYADSNIDIVKKAPKSIRSGKKVEEITKKDGYIKKINKGYGI